MIEVSNTNDMQALCAVMFPKDKHSINSYTNKIELYITGDVLMHFIVGSSASVQHLFGKTDAIKTLLGSIACSLRSLPPLDSNFSSTDLIIASTRHFLIQLEERYQLEHNLSQTEA